MRARATNLLYLFTGALAVAIVAGVLSLGGDDPARPAAAQSTATPAPATASTGSAASGTDVAAIYRRVSAGVVFVSVNATSRPRSSGMPMVRK